MTALVSFQPSDRLLVALLVVLAVATILVAAEAHAFCDLFCIHGDRMIPMEICAGRG